MTDNFYAERQIEKEDNLNYGNKKEKIQNNNLIDGLMEKINDRPTPEDYRKLKIYIPEAVNEFELKDGSVGFSLNKNAIKKWKAKGKDS